MDNFKIEIQNKKKISKKVLLTTLIVVVCSAIYITTQFLFAVHQFTPSIVISTILTPFIFIYGVSAVLAAFAGAFKIDFFKAFHIAAIIMSIMMLFASSGTYMFYQEQHKKNNSEHKLIERRNNLGPSQASYYDACSSNLENVINIQKAITFPSLSHVFNS